MSGVEILLKYLDNRIKLNIIVRALWLNFEFCKFIHAIEQKLNIYFLFIPI